MAPSFSPLSLTEGREIKVVVLEPEGEGAKVTITGHARSYEPGYWDVGSVWTIAEDNQWSHGVVSVEISPLAHPRKFGATISAAVVPKKDGRAVVQTTLVYLPAGWEDNVPWRSADPVNNDLDHWVGNEQIQWDTATLLFEGTVPQEQLPDWTTG